MKIQTLVLATILFPYVWTLQTDLKEELVDPFDMVNYDAVRQSMIYKQKSKPFLKDHLKQILETAEKLGLPGNDEEIHYDAEVIFTRQALNEIIKLLKDEDWDSTILEQNLHIILLKLKNHDDINFFSVDLYVLMVAIFMSILCGFLGVFVNCHEDFIPKNQGLLVAVEDNGCEGKEGEPKVDQELTGEGIRNAEQFPIQHIPRENNGSYGQQSFSKNVTSLQSSLAEAEIGTPEEQTNQSLPTSLPHAELQVIAVSGAEEPVDGKLCPVACAHEHVESGVEEHSSVSPLFLIDDIYTEFPLNNENSSEV